LNHTLLLRPSIRIATASNPISTREDEMEPQELLDNKNNDEVNARHVICIPQPRMMANSI
jgi:hypothetical protein